MVKSTVRSICSRFSASLRPRRVRSTFATRSFFFPTRFETPRQKFSLYFGENFIFSLFSLDFPNATSNNILQTLTIREPRFRFRDLSSKTRSPLSFSFVRIEKEIKTTPQTPSLSPPSDAASTPAVGSPETPKRRRFPTLTWKPFLWTVAILAPPLAYVSPLGFFLPELLNGPEIVQFHLPWGPTLLIPRSLLKVAIALTTVVFWLAAPLGTVASIGAFRRSRLVWAKTLAALLIVANAWLLLARPVVFLLEDVAPEFVVDFLLSI